MDLKSKLSEMIDQLAELETSARKLVNQNFADLIGAARGRLAMASDHPDLEYASRQADSQEPLPFDPAWRQGEPLNSGGNVMFAAGDPGRAAQGEEARRRAEMPAPGTPFPGGPAPAPTVGDGLRPGDPAVNFQGQNPDFRHPENVDLNKDGTLKRAPNALGRSDDRDGGK